VTWLLDLDRQGLPIVARLPCPLDKVPEQLARKDSTMYEGLIHTNNALREEFFDDPDEPLTNHKPPMMDFTSLYDSTQPDFTEFIGGLVFTEAEVYADIGSPENWTHREGRDQPVSRSPEPAAEVAALVSACLGPDRRLK
jgi:hypothetical protein